MQYELDYSKDYQKVHNLVYEYQAGSSIAIEKLVKSFEKFFLNYVYFIKFGRYNNSSVRRFKGLFPKNLQLIKLFGELTEEDIKHDLIIIFSNMCKRYKDDKPSFHTYIARNFHFYAYRYWEKLLRDPTGNETTLSVDAPMSSDDESLTLINILKDDRSLIERNEILNNIDMWYKLKEVSGHKNIKKNLYSNTFFDNDWINGVTCTKEFKILTPLERQIIKMRYADNLTDQQIGENLNICRGSINKRKNMAKSKIIEYLKYSKKEKK